MVNIPSILGKPTMLVPEKVNMPNRLILLSKNLTEKFILVNHLKNHYLNYNTIKDVLEKNLNHTQKIYIVKLYSTSLIQY